MEKNDIKTGIVFAVGMNGEGVLREEDKVVFVPFTLPGEKIRYKILKVGDGFAFGKVMEIFTPAEERVRPVCEVFGKCGGCQLQHVRYQNQLKIKEDNIKNCFKKIAFLDVDVKPSSKGKSEYYYRNKLQLPVSVDKDGNTIMGFYADNSHRVVPINDCPINALWTKDVIKAFKEYFELFGIKGYDEKTGKGDVREITVKDVRGNLIFTIVSPKENIPGLAELVGILKRYFNSGFSLFYNVNASSGNVIYGDNFKLIYGCESYSADMLGIKYKAGVKSFMQVNDNVCSKLYNMVCNLASLDENTVVIDAYSGAGLLTALLAKKAKRAIGVEIEPEAVRLADALAKENGLSQKIVNYLGKCEEILPDIIEKERAEGNKIVLVLDPPRKGCDVKVIEAIIKSDIDKIIYVSCKPSTLARDVGLIVGTLNVSENGIKKAEEPVYRYNIESVRPYDMFAQTKHVETVVLMSRVDR